MPAAGCVVVCGYWNHWPCVFPQHGPGRKHERTLTLERWQQEVVRTRPAAFVRGRFRWHLTNHSTEIQWFCTDTLDVLGIPSRQSSWKMISVSRREGVAHGRAGQRAQ